MAEPRDVTELLRSYHAGNAAAGEQVFTLVYDELRQAAHRAMAREGARHTRGFGTTSSPPTHYAGEDPAALKRVSGLSADSRHRASQRSSRVPESG